MTADITTLADSINNAFTQLQVDGDKTVQLFDAAQQALQKTAAEYNAETAAIQKRQTELLKERQAVEAELSSQNPWVRNFAPAVISGIKQKGRALQQEYTQLQTLSERADADYSRRIEQIKLRTGLAEATVDVRNKQRQGLSDYVDTFTKVETARKADNELFLRSNIGQAVQWAENPDTLPERFNLAEVYSAIRKEELANLALSDARLKNREAQRLDTEAANAKTSDELDLLRQRQKKAFEATELANEFWLDNASPQLLAQMREEVDSATGMFVGAEGTDFEGMVLPAYKLDKRIAAFAAESESTAALSAQAMFESFSTDNKLQSLGTVVGRLAGQAEASLLQEPLVSDVTGRPVPLSQINADEFPDATIQADFKTLQQKLFLQQELVSNAKMTLADVVEGPVSPQEAERYANTPLNTALDKDIATSAEELNKKIVDNYVAQYKKSLQPAARSYITTGKIGAAEMPSVVFDELNLPVPTVTNKYMNAGMKVLQESMQKISRELFGDTSPARNSTVDVAELQTLSTFAEMKDFLTTKDKKARLSQAQIIQQAAEQVQADTGRTVRTHILQAVELDLWGEAIKQLNKEQPSGTEMPIWLGLSSINGSLTKAAGVELLGNGTVSWQDSVLYKELDRRTAILQKEGLLDPGTTLFDLFKAKVDNLLPTFIKNQNVLKPQSLIEEGIRGMFIGDSQSAIQQLRVMAMSMEEFNAQAIVAGRKDAKVAADNAAYNQELNIVENWLNRNN